MRSSNTIEANSSKDFRGYISSIDEALSPIGSPGSTENELSNYTDCEELDTGFSVIGMPETNGAHDVSEAESNVNAGAAETDDSIANLFTLRHVINLRVTWVV